MSGEKSCPFQMETGLDLMANFGIFDTEVEIIDKMQRILEWSPDCFDLGFEFYIPRTFEDNSESA